MACFHPIEAWRLQSGGVFFGAEPKAARPLTLPCGQCVGCRLERSRQWAVRFMHESSLHESNSFVTLTYNDSNVGESLNYKDFQNFMKRLIAARRREVLAGTEALTESDRREALRAGRIRFGACGEYGDSSLRPHFHALLFGKSFPDRYPWRKSSSGFQLYRSAELERLWPLGQCEIGEVSFDSAAYVARYCMKKVNGQAADWINPRTGLSAYQRVRLDGEIVDVEPEMFHVSNREGIAKDWLRLYWKDVYVAQGGHVVVNGMKCKPPRYYDNYVREMLAFDALAAERERDMMARRSDNTPERLAAKESVTKARLSFKVRSLE